MNDQQRSQSPGDFKLGPLSFGDVIANTFRILFGNPGHFLVLFLLVVCPVIAAQHLIWEEGFQEAFGANMIVSVEQPPFFLLPMVFQMIISSMVNAVLAGVLVTSIAAVYFGRTPGVRESIIDLVDAVVPLLLASLMLSVLDSLIGVFQFFPLITSGPGSTNVLLSWGSMILYILREVLFFVYVPVIVLEGTGALASLKRSFALMRGERIKTFFLLLLMVHIPWFGISMIAGYYGPVSIGYSQGLLDIENLLRAVFVVLVTGFQVTMYCNTRVVHEDFLTESVADLFG